MPWGAQTVPTGAWASQEEERVYFASYYALDDYVVDEEWTLAEEATSGWVPVS